MDPKASEEKAGPLQSLNVLNVPRSFCECPLSHKIPKEPVVFVDGFVYEGEVLRAWVKENPGKIPHSDKECDSEPPILPCALVSAVLKGLAEAEEEVKEDEKGEVKTDEEEEFQQSEEKPPASDAGDSPQSQLEKVTETPPPDAKMDESKFQEVTSKLRSAVMCLGMKKFDRGQALFKESSLIIQEQLNAGNSSSESNNSALWSIMLEYARRCVAHMLHKFACEVYEFSNKNSAQAPEFALTMESAELFAYVYRWLYDWDTVQLIVGKAHTLNEDVSFKLCALDMESCGNLGDFVGMEEAYKHASTLTSSEDDVSEDDVSLMNLLFTKLNKRGDDEFGLSERIDPKADAQIRLAGGLLLMERGEFTGAEVFLSSVFAESHPLSQIALLCREMCHAARMGENSVDSSIASVWEAFPKMKLDDDVMDIILRICLQLVSDDHPFLLNLSHAILDRVHESSGHWQKARIIYYLVLVNIGAVEDARKLMRDIIANEKVKSLLAHIGDVLFENNEEPYSRMIYDQLVESGFLLRDESLQHYAQCLKNLGDWEKAMEMSGRVRFGKESGSEEDAMNDFLIKIELIDDVLVAIRMIDEFVENSAPNPTIRNQLVLKKAQLFTTKGMMVEASGELRGLIKELELDGEALIPREKVFEQLAIVEFRRKDFKVAKQTFERIGNLRFASMLLSDEAMIIWSKACWETKDRDSALQIAEMAMDGAELSKYTWLLEMYEEMKSPVEIIDRCDGFLEEFPEETRLLQHKMRALTKLKRLDEAIAVLNGFAKEIDPQRLLRVLGDMLIAISEVGREVEENPGAEGMMAFLGSNAKFVCNAVKAVGVQSCEQQVDDKKGKVGGDNLRRIIDIIVFCKSQKHEKTGSIAELIECASTLCKQLDESEEVMYDVAVNFRKQKRFEECVSVLEMCSSPECLKLLMAILSLGKPHECKELCLSCLKHEDEDVKKVANFVLEKIQ
jgi:tetratricopeptide (TPR) repeat protein